ncbi:aminoglycoside phosphotransferase (APT) family kinase protein [Antricoccus suffuscus]|uniref:Aminoglycoside phosphotransferase (APT) family kinase protein n=1 Tax=Antricoccus suffuscus TaxID=1629062 RepID=A0A2T0ZWE0_9ACTN|nr:phosphotransferase family protein [Antricoccus suffuscus]PRZ40398.1 aminoglycoside phosphotransferase (APT) family kinase protein [Antricoccus suffuscus]
MSASKDAPTTHTSVDLVDLDTVRTWMDKVHLGDGPITNAKAIGGGTQNIMLMFDRAGKTYVLRRGPEHLRPHTNRAILREMEVLQALGQTDVPHPRFIGGCDDERVLDGAIFYLMEPIDGFNPGDGLPPLYAENADVRKEAVLRVVDAAAALGAVDPRKVGLEDIGSPRGFLERQVERWLTDLEKYQEFDEYRGRKLDGVSEVAAWLNANFPKTWKPGLMHGDFHLANVMLRRDRPEVAAVVDWEMCTQGDPLLDIGWLIATGADKYGEGLLDNPMVVAGGVPTPAELVERYSLRTDRDLSSINWYAVLACFKLGIVLEGTYARALAGLAPVHIGERLHHHTELLFARAQRIIADPPV